MRVDGVILAIFEVSTSLMASGINNLTAYTSQLLLDTLWSLFFLMFKVTRLLCVILLTVIVRIVFCRVLMTANITIIESIFYL